jgi:hypothetical protein
MAENPNNQPRPYDVVLGGNNPLAKVSTGATGKQSTQAQTTSARVNTNLTGEQSSQSQGAPTQSSTVEKSSELETSTVGGGTLLRWIFWFGVAVFYFINPETNGSPFESIANTCLIAWVIGLINPNWTIRFGLPNSRWTVTLIYLTIAVIYMMISLGG